MLESSTPGIAQKLRLDTNRDLDGVVSTGVSAQLFPFYEQVYLFPDFR